MAAGVAVYSALPHTWVKIVWGLAAGAVVYLVGATFVTGSTIVVDGGRSLT